jgi:UDP-2-acetamido-2,6-beta-L-arabino-hexul-4-ose reductase
VRKVLITGGRGFLGRNLAVHLQERSDCDIKIIDQEDSAEELNKALIDADVIFHLAGVNRPETPIEFTAGNAELTEHICNFLRLSGRCPNIVFSSSIQASLDNPYGVSKKRAEDALLKFGTETGANVRIYRLKNLFGKWCRPNYNSVTATFCHNIANDLPVSISDPLYEIELSYVDDVVAAFVKQVDPFRRKEDSEIPSYRISLSDLAGRIQAFGDMKTTLTLPDFADPFNRALYATYLSFVPPAALESRLDVRVDARGSLAEFIKQGNFGQVFVSRTKPGITRGNHYHHTKTEKFFVVEGHGLIRMKNVQGGPVQEYRVSGDCFQVIDIPPGFTHSITNVGAGDLVTLFWSSEIFDPDRPDTYYRSVDQQVESETAKATNE